MALLWLAVALAFTVLEMVTLAFYAVFVVVGALAAALAAALGAPFWVQVVTLAVVSVLGVVGARPVLMRMVHHGHNPDVLSGAAAMIGQEAMVVDPIQGAQPGHVRIGGENWPAVTADGSAVEQGQTIRVVSLRNATLVVAPVSRVPATAGA